MHHSLLPVNRGLATQAAAHLPATLANVQGWAWLGSGSLTGGGGWKERYWWQMTETQLQLA